MTTEEFTRGMHRLRDAGYSRSKDRRAERAVLLRCGVVEVPSVMITHVEWGKPKADE